MTARPKLLNSIGCAGWAQTLPEEAPRVVELYLDRLEAGRSELALDDELVREDQTLQGHVVPGFRARVSGTLDVDSMDQKVLVHGEFTVRRQMICDRSGEAFEMAYPATVEVMILRSPGRGGRYEDAEAEDEDAWVIQQSGGVVVLDDALLEAIVLDEPHRVISPEHENDETIGADADEEEMDPRWEALRRLREDEGEAQVQAGREEAAGRRRFIRIVLLRFLRGRFGV